MKTITTKSAYDWLKVKPNIDNIRNLPEGFTKGISWVNKTIRYAEGTAAIHIYMPKANITEVLRT